MSPRLSDLLLSSQSDERLVSLARAGHERAFAVIVERYRSELHALARRLCADGRSEDVVQQAFLSAFTALRSGSEVRHLRGWLYQIVRNAAGRPQAPPCVPLDRVTPSASTLEEVVQQRALAMATLSEIARLPARQREAMIGTALDGRGRTEVASSMGLSEGAVRQLVHRARTTLRGAATALTPWPLARWISAVGPDAATPAAVAAGAGAVGSGGLALKLTALLASGTLLTGAAVQAVHHHPPAAHGGDARAAISIDTRGAPARAHSPSLAALPAPSHDGSKPSHSGAAVGVIGPAAHHEIVHHARPEGTSMGSGLGSAGAPVIGSSGRGGRTAPEGSSASGPGEGKSGVSTVSTGSDDHGQGGEQSPVTRTGGNDGTSSGGRSGSGTGSDGGSGDAAQMASDSHPLDSTVEGSDSHGDSGSSVGSPSAEGSASSSGSGGGSSSDGGSGSHGGSGPGGGSGPNGGSGSGDGGETSGD